MGILDRLLFGENVSEEPKPAVEEPKKEPKVEEPVCPWGGLYCNNLHDDAEVVDPRFLPDGVEEDLYHTWVREIKQKNAQIKAEAEEELKAVKERHARDMESLCEFDPEAELKECTAGTFLCIEGHQIPIKHIESIEVERPKDPIYGFFVQAIRVDLKYDHRSYSYCNGIMYYAMDRGIKDWPRWDRRHLPNIIKGFEIVGNRVNVLITMSSGREIRLSCWDEQAEIYQDKLTSMWIGECK